MSVVDDSPIDRDGKAGFSTICRAGDHKTCQMAKARCSCDCHGGVHQEPPIRPEEVPAVSEATVTALPSQPITAPEHRCECGYVAVSKNGLSIHRGRSHGAKKRGGYTSSKPATQLKPPPSGPAPGATKKTPPAVEPASERQLLAIIGQAYHDLNGADVATCIDSAASILDAISNASWRIVEA